MTIFDGILILAMLGCVLSLVSVGYFLVRRKFRRAKRVLLALAIFLVVYAVVLVSVSLVSPQQVLAMHQDRCFDDWCLSVEQVVQQPTIGSEPMLVRASGVFDLVTVRVSSRARAVSQRALDAQDYLLDAQGQRYDPDQASQHVLDASGQGGNHWTVSLPQTARLLVPLSSTCRKAHPTLPSWSPMVCSRMCWSSEVTKVSCTNRRSSSSHPHDFNRSVLLV